MFFNCKYIYFVVLSLGLSVGSVSTAQAEAVGQVCKLTKTVNLRGTARGTGEKIRITKGESFKIVRQHEKSLRILFEGATGKGWIHQKRVSRICTLSGPEPAGESETPPEEAPAPEVPTAPASPAPEATPEPAPLVPETTPEPEAIPAPEPPADTPTPEPAVVVPEVIESVPEPVLEAPLEVPAEAEAVEAPAEQEVPVKLPEVIVVEPQWIESANRFKLAVMDVEVNAPDLDPLIGESMSSVLAAELAARSRGRFDVVSRGDMRMMVGQVVEAQQYGCTDPSCLMDLGKLSSAEKMVTARIARIGEDLVFTLELVDLVNGIVIARQASSWKGDPRGLVELCRPYLARLIEGSGADNYMGQLQVLANQDEALVHVDNVEVGPTPIELYPKIPIGRHRVQVKKPGFLLYDQDVVINHRETTLLQVELVDEDSLKPWYKKWWVWTGAAALVGGAVTTAVLLQSEETNITVDRLP